MSKGSKGKTGIDRKKLAEHLYAESSRATGRGRADDVRKLLTGIEGRELFPSRDPSSLLTWAREELHGGRFEGVPWFFLAMGKYFETVGKWDDAGEWYSMAGERSGRDGSRSVYLDAIISLAHLMAKKGEGKEAGQLYRTVLKDSRDVRDHPSTMRALGGLGALKFDEGAFAEARRCFRRVIRLSGKTGDKSWHAHMLNDLGAVYSTEGRFCEALVSYRSALEIYESEGYERGIARCLHNIAAAYLDSNEPASAGVYFSRSQQVCASLGWEEMHILNLLGRTDLLVRICELDAALSLCREAKERALITGDSLSLVEACRLEASMLYEKGERKGCFGLLEEGAELAKKLKAGYALAQILENRAAFLGLEGKLTAASADLRKAIALYGTMGLVKKQRVTEANLKRIKKKGG